MAEAAAAEMTQNEANFRHIPQNLPISPKNNCMLLSCCLALDSWPHALVHFSVARVRFCTRPTAPLCTVRALACLASPTAKEDQRQTASASSYPILRCRLGYPTFGRPMAQIM